MYKKIIVFMLCFISTMFVNNPAMAIHNENQIINKKEIIIDKYSLDLKEYLNVSSDNSEPIYLVRERRVRETNEMSIAWIGSFFISGLGQILLGDIGRGILFLIFTGLGYALFILPGLILHIWSIIDAYNIAKRKAEGEDEAKLIEERITKLMLEMNKIETSKGSIKYNLANF